MKRFLVILAACSSGSKATPPPPPPPADAAAPPLDAEPTTATVEGHVIGPDGKPVPGATVRIEHDDGVTTQTVASMKTDAAGHYEFDAYLVASDLQIGAFTDDASPRSSDYFLLVEQGEHKTLDLPLDRAASIAGVVVDTAGKPVAGAQILLDPDPGRTVTSGADGAFQIGGLVPDEYRVLVDHAPKSPRVNLATSTSHATGVRIVIDPTSAPRQ